MKKIFLFLISILPFGVNAQLLDAEMLLDRVIAAMRTESPLQMDYSYTVYDEDEVVICDKGVMRLDGNCYSLVMDDMGVWCNGDTQWSYMREINEIYITDALSSEAQNMSPLFIMESYRNASSKTVQMNDDVTAVVELQVPSEEGVERIVLFVDIVCNRLKAMNVYVSSYGRLEIVLDGYQTNCKFDDNVYECPVKEYKTAEVVDMR